MKEVMECSKCGGKCFVEEGYSTVYRCSNCGAMFSRRVEPGPMCEFGGDERDCAECAYNDDYEWSEEYQSCMRKLR